MDGPAEKMTAVVHFHERNDDRIPSPWREYTKPVVINAIQSTRPTSEAWTVVTRELENLDRAFDLTLNGRTESLVVSAEDADPDDPRFGERLRGFVQKNWPATRG